MKLDLPACGAASWAPLSATSEAAMRAAGLACSGGRPEPGSSGWSDSRSGAIDNCAARGTPRGRDAGTAATGGGGDDGGAGLGIGVAATEVADGASLTARTVT